MQLTEAINKLNGSFGFGNQILYNMCADNQTDIGNANHLADMIWLIGRSYAASPERRTYGYKKNADGKVEKDNNGKRQTLFKPKNADNGRGGFFISIANFIIQHKDFPSLKGNVKKLQKASYDYKGLDNDIALLTTSIVTVYLFNQFIRFASESFDGLTDEMKKQGAACKNQISFSSKFLHFHCPKNVYIIDQYSLDGGKSLIPQKKLSRDIYFEGETKELLENLSCLKEECEKIYSRVNTEIVNTYPNIFSEDKLSKQDEKISTYMQHCVRAYCLSKYFFNAGIKNISPRFIDDLLLRIK